MISGRTWAFGDNIDTDQIIPSQYLVLRSIDEMATHSLETQRKEFASQVRPGDVIVAKQNFGCGSSREQAPTVLRALGVGAIIATSFARIFFRNSINMGIPVIVLPQAGEINEGDQLDIDLASGTIENRTNGRRYSFAPLEGLPAEIMAAGGLIPYLKSIEASA
ncbi:MAG TPA: 3-isopropylmalate dehydratase small subunit [Candidatus Baltobacteraceae bacterium]|jgi:3-isopropylmalate dehydratase small subunit|nr:3-isopropylmalate dehydratase small subunit [Candidatus Baltobacteraceae bacterium]